MLQKRYLTPDQRSDRLCFPRFSAKLAFCLKQNFHELLFHPVDIALYLMNFYDVRLDVAHNGGGHETLPSPLLSQKCNHTLVGGDWEEGAIPYRGVVPALNTMPSLMIPTAPPIKQG